MGGTDLPKEFDVVIVGTGFCESILSAAASRNGHSVLHLDPRDFYGGKWTSVSMDGLESKGFVARPLDAAKDDTTAWNDLIKEVEQVWYDGDPEKQIALRKLSRRFNIDVFPKVILAKEDIIELLIESDVSRYLEFKCVNKLLVALPPPNDGEIEPIPLSRSDIFVSKSLGLVEKRKLAKFIELVLQNSKEEVPSSESPVGEKSKGTESDQQTPIPPRTNRCFNELVQAATLTPKLEHLIRSSVTSLEDSFEVSGGNEGFERRCQAFLQSIGRYGNQTPFLWTLYGIGEICQAFCRMSAIYGGIFILKKNLHSVKEMSDCVEVKLDDADIKTKHLILGPELVYPPQALTKPARTIVRGILITSGGPFIHQPLGSEDSTDNHIWVYKIGDAEVLELNHSSQAVPKPYHLIHVTCPLPTGSKEQPRSIVEILLRKYVNFIPSGNEMECPESTENSKPLENAEESPAKPFVLYGCYYFIDFYEEPTNIDCAEETSGRIFRCTSSFTDISGEIRKAREIFSSLYPTEEFLPKPIPPVENENLDD